MRALSKLVRDTLVNDSSMRTLLGVASTASAAVFPALSEKTGVYPQIAYSIIEGTTDPGMISSNGILSFYVQAQGTGGINPYITCADIADRISGLFDDVNLTGAAATGTAVAILLSIRSAGIPVTYDEMRKVYSKIISYGFKVIGG